MKKFGHLNVPSHWEHFWSKYPEGYTMLEALLNWVKQVDDMVDNVNDWNEYLEEFVETFDEKLRPHVREFMQDLDDSGRLSEIINDEIFSDIQRQIKNIKVSVIDFGAVGDGTTDDSGAFLAAKDYCMEHDFTLYAPPGYEYYIGNDIDLFGLRYIEFAGRIIGKNDFDIMDIGYNAQTTWPTRYEIADVETMVLRLSGLKNALVDIQFANQLVLFADSSNTLKASMAYCTFKLGIIRDLKIDSVGSGWINENRFFGGRIKDLTIGGDYNHNHNHFYNPNFEGAVINIEKGAFNYFHNYRGEFGIEVTLGPTTYGNVFVRSWYSSSIQYLRGRGKIVAWEDEGRENHNIGANDYFYNRRNIYTLDAHTGNIDFDIFHRRKRNELRDTLERVGNPETPFFETRIIRLTQPVRLHLYASTRAFKFRLHIYDELQQPITSEVGYFTSIISGLFNSEGYYEKLGDELDLQIAMIPGQGVEFVKLELLTDSYESNFFDWIKVDIVEPIGQPNDNIPYKDEYRHNRATTPPDNNNGGYHTGEIIYAKDPAAAGCVGWVNTLNITGGRWKPFGTIT